MIINYWEFHNYDTIFWNIAVSTEWWMTLNEIFSHGHPQVVLASSAGISSKQLSSNSWQMIVIDDGEFDGWRWVTMGDDGWRWVTMGDDDDFMRFRSLIMLDMMVSCCGFDERPAAVGDHWMVDFAISHAQSLGKLQTPHSPPSVVTAGAKRSMVITSNHQQPSITNPWHTNIQHLPNIFTSPGASISTSAPSVPVPSPNWKLLGSWPSHLTAVTGESARGDWWTVVILMLGYLTIIPYES